MCNLNSKTIILGVTGSIASYKAVEIASILTRYGAKVITVMTKSSINFITPLTFESLTHQKVYTSLFEKHDYEPEHISLSERADLILIAPASANIIAKCANGLADDLLSCIILASKSPLLLAPAMNNCMYSNPATQSNIEKLKKYGADFIGPQEGRLASGKSGLGRMSDITDITNNILKIFKEKTDVC